MCTRHLALPAWVDTYDTLREIEVALLFYL